MSHWKLYNIVNFCVLEATSFIQERKKTPKLNNKRFILVYLYTWL